MFSTKYRQLPLTQNFRVEIYYSRTLEERKLNHLGEYYLIMIISLKKTLGNYSRKTILLKFRVNNL